MRIAMISEHGDPLSPIGGQQSGGQNVYVYELSRMLSKKGISVDVFSRWDNRKSSQMVRYAERAKVIRLKAGPRNFMPKENYGKYMPEFVEHFLEYARTKKVKYDLIHTHYYFSGWVGMQLRNILHIPQVHTYHSLLVNKNTFFAEDNAISKERFSIEGKIAQIVERIIANSPQEKLNLMKYGKEIDDNKIAIIPAGVNLQRFSSIAKCKARARLGIPEGAKVILFAGRMEKNKGAEVLVKAINSIKKKSPATFKNLKVYMFSGDPRKKFKKEKTENQLRSKIQGLIKKHGLSETIELRQGIDQEKLHFYYCAADLVAVPSYYESFCLVAVEAMASGAPVVASDVGGMKWTIEDGITGFKAEPGNHKDFANKMIRILKDNDLQKRLSENASIHAENNFSWSGIADKTISIYKELIKKE